MPEVFVNFRPEPDPKSSARPTTMVFARLFSLFKFVFFSDASLFPSPTEKRAKLGKNYTNQKAV